MVKHVIGQSNILFLSIENTKIGDKHNHCIALTEEGRIELIIQHPSPPLKSAFARTNIYTIIEHQVQNCENYRKKMAFAYLSVVFFAWICIANRTNPEYCSAVGGYSGTVRDRDNSMTEILNSVQPPLCHGGVQCKHVCLLDSSEWNSFEMRKVSPLFSYGLL